MLHSHNLSLLVQVSVSIFSPSFSSSLESPGIAMSTIKQFLSSLLMITMSGLLSSITWSHWIQTSHKILILSFSTTLLGVFSYHFSLRSNPHFSHSFSGLSLQHCHVFICIPSELTSFTQSQQNRHSQPSHHTIYMHKGYSAVLSICLTPLVGTTSRRRPDCL